MVRKLKFKENFIIDLDEYLENKNKYLFEIKKPLKSEMNLDNPLGQGNKIEKLTSQLHLRIGKLEENILNFGSKENKMSKSNFVRHLILKYGKNFVKNEIEEKYNNYLKKYEILSEELEEKKILRECLLKKRGADKKTANQLCYKRTKLKFEIENIKSEMNHLEGYFKRYKKVFEE